MTSILGVGGKVLAGEGGRSLCERTPGLPHAKHSQFQLVPAGSSWLHNNPSTATAEPISDAGCISEKTYLRKGKNMAEAEA